MTEPQGACHPPRSQRSEIRVDMPDEVRERVVAECVAWLFQDYQCHPHHTVYATHV